MTGFIHSQGVPRLYKVASTITQLVQEKGASIKQLVFSDKYRHYNTKALYALIVETVQHATILDQLIENSKILSETQLSPWLARILITELLWGKKVLPPSDCKPIKTVLAYQSTFVGALREAVKNGTHENEPRQIKAFLKPRYIRVNTLLMSIGDAIDTFRYEGWRRGVPDIPDDYVSFLAKLKNIAEDEFIQDFHVKEMFAFPPRTEFYQHELYQNGSLILQDKATSLAPYLLNPPPGSSVLDMCAAPGLKTTQLAAIMQNQGTLYAVEKDLKRYQLLCDFTTKHSVSCAKTINADATTLTPIECEKVEYILVDPTCSGSGMPRPTTAKDVKSDHERLAKLSEFQQILLEGAMTKFPDVKRVVYSTCSTYHEENEQVVEKTLKSVNTDPERPYFKLSDDLPLTNRGSSDYECGSKCLFFDPDKNLTTGFFLAVFERTDVPKEEVSVEKKRKPKRKKGPKDYKKKKREKWEKKMKKRAEEVSGEKESEEKTNDDEVIEDIDSSSRLKKKKKKHEEITDNVNSDDMPKKKKKKNRNVDEDVNGIEPEETVDSDVESRPVKKKKKKHEEFAESSRLKKKKKKHEDLTM